jgi:multidrug transporter EmrE-like cation transporter
LAETTLAQRRFAIFLVFCVTLVNAGAQVLIKNGANGLGHPTLMATGIAILTTPQLFFGYSLYALSMVLLVVALRHGELSAVYPVIALTFVWVTILSAAIFGDKMNPAKLAGIALICGGVAALGAGSGKKK